MKRRGVASMPIYLVLVAMSAGASALVAGLGTMQEYRYAEWASIGRILGESLVLVLPLVAMTSAAASAVGLRRGLIWLTVGLPRAQASILRTASATAAAAVLGYVLGTLPLLVWGMRTATYGSVPWLILLAATIWVAATSLITQALVRAIGSVWVGPGIALCWVVVFYIGRIADQAYQAPSTRLPFLPFDGNMILLRVDQVAPALTITRMVGGLVAIVLGILWIWKSHGYGTRLVRLRHTIVQPATAITLAAAIGASLHAVTLTSIMDQPVACEQTTGPQVCVFAAHRIDLPVVSHLVGTLYDAVGRPLLPAARVSEAITGPADRDVVTISIPTSTKENLTNTTATQLGSWIVNFDVCINGHAAQDSVSAATLTGLWFAQQAGAKIPSQQQTAELLRWSADPAGANTRLRAVANEVSQCRLRTSQLP